MLFSFILDRVIASSVYLCENILCKRQRYNGVRVVYHLVRVDRYLRDAEAFLGIELHGNYPIRCC